MGNILVIDHPVDNKESFFLGRLLSYLYHNAGFQPDKKNHTDLKGIDPRTYQAVIHASGFCKIRDNPELATENEISDKCIEYSIPELGLCHGAQIMAVHQAEDDAIIESTPPRTSIHSDYTFIETPTTPHIVKGIDISQLTSKEFHKYDITKVGPEYRKLIVDPAGNVILAAHLEKPSFMLQMHPCYVPKPGETVNSIHILDNFLELVKNHL